MMWQYIKEKLEYVVGTVVGFVGWSMDVGNKIVDASPDADGNWFSQINFAENIANGLFGLFFLIIGVTITHYWKKFLNSRDAEAEGKNDTP